MKYEGMTFPTEMIWFVVERCHGKLLTSICYDRLP